MATTYCTKDGCYGCRWSIYNLSSYWDNDYYQQAVLATDSNHPSGSSSEPSGILSRQYPPSSGTNYNTPSVTFSSGLQPNTRYTLYGYCKANNGLWYPAGSATVTTDMLKLSTPYLSSYSSTTTSVTFTIAAVTNATYYWVDWWKEGVYQGSTGHTSSNRTFSYTNLEPDSSYVFKYYCSNIGNYYDSNTNTLNINTIDPTPGIPTNNSNTPGNEQVAVTWNRPSSHTYLDGYWFYYKQHSSGTWIAAGGQDTQNDSVTKVFTGLTNGISYDFMVRAYAYEGGYYYPSGNSTTVTATPINTRPSYFSWDTSKVQGQPFNLTATEWNRLIQNVKDVHDYKLGSYDATAYPMTTVSQGGTFFATLFNQVRFAIGSLNSTGIAEKILGNVITAADLNTLRDKLNGIN